MNEIVFDPWIGSQYRGGQIRLLIIGESLYEYPDEIPAKATSTVVEKWKSGEKNWSIRYLVAAARLLSGLEARQIDRPTVLERIAIYNFVQVMMPSRRNRPTAEHLQRSLPAFHSVLGLLDPTHILVTGKLVYDYMPEFDRPPMIRKFGEKDLEIGEYRTPSGFAFTMPIPHLSRGFSPPVWHQAVKSFLLL